MHALFEIDGIKDLDPVGLIDRPPAFVQDRPAGLIFLWRTPHQCPAAIHQDLGFRIRDNIGTVHLQ